MNSQSSNNIISDLNYRASASLSAGTTWSGTFEPVFNMNCASIYLNCSDLQKIGRLYIDWSIDGSTTFKTVQMRIMTEQLNKTIYTSIKGKSMRVRFLACTIIDTRTVPVANDYAGLEIITMYHKEKLDSYDIDINRQKRYLKCFDNASTVYKLFGKGTALLTSNYALPTTGTNIRLYNSSASNSEASANLRTCLIIGLDVNFAEIYHIMPVTAGGYTTGVATTWIRVNECIPWTFGSNYIIASGTVLSVEINIGSWSPCNVFSLTSVNTWMPSMGFYTVPAGNTCKIISKTQTCNVTNNNVEVGILKRSGNTSTTERHLRVFNFDVVSPNNQIYFPGIDSSMNGGDSLCVSAYFQSGTWHFVTIEYELS